MNFSKNISLNQIGKHFAVHDNRRERKTRVKVIPFGTYLLYFYYTIEKKLKKYIERERERAFKKPLSTHGDLTED